jgi:hypothetical protein
MPWELVANTIEIIIYDELEILDANNGSPGGKNEWLQDRRLGRP